MAGSFVRSGWPRPAHARWQASCAYTMQGGFKHSCFLLLLPQVVTDSGLCASSAPRFARATCVLRHLHPHRSAQHAPAAKRSRQASAACTHQGAYGMALSRTRWCSCPGGACVQSYGAVLCFMCLALGPADIGALAEHDAGHPLKSVHQC